jgi:hypothetical protein
MSVASCFIPTCIQSVALARTLKARAPFEFAVQESCAAALNRPRGPAPVAARTATTLLQSTNLLQAAHAIEKAHAVRGPGLLFA